MTRSVSISLRRSLEANFSDEANLIFLTMDHATIADPIRVVSDTNNYTYQGNTFIGFPFDIQFLSDDETPPSARLAIQNVDSQIGYAVRRLTSPPICRIDFMHSDDFNLTVIPRVALGTPEVITLGSNLFLVNITVNAAEVTGELRGWDYLQRVYPGKRAMKEALPGVFR